MKGEINMDKMYIFINSNNWSDEYECRVCGTKEYAISKMKKDLYEEVGKFVLDEGYIPIVKNIDECNSEIIYATDNEIMSCKDTKELDTAYYKVIEVYFDDSSLGGTADANYTADRSKD